MPNQYRFQLVNVFAESLFGGNALCVFEDVRGMTDDQMQALARQFNLSETTFLVPSDCATAKVRIFTPSFEMAFAGHPTLGSAHVARDVLGAGDHLALEMKAGVIPVTAVNDLWTLQAPAPTYREATLSRAELAHLLGVAEGEVLPGAMWVNTGSEQLIIPLSSADAVKRVTVNAEQLSRITSIANRSMAYVFAANGPHRLVSRFFFLVNGGVVEDPGTGSATANLGGWFIRQKSDLPVEYAIEQGAATGRPCHLGLRINEQQQIFVSGRVIPIGKGEVSLA